MSEDLEVDNLGDEIIKGLRQAVAYMEGDTEGSRTRTVRAVITESEVDVRAIRKRMEKTQKEFAALFGFSLPALRAWEQGTRQPVKATRLLLLMLRDEPEFVQRFVDRLGEAPFEEHQLIAEAR